MAEGEEEKKKFSVHTKGREKASTFRKGPKTLAAGPENSWGEGLWGKGRGCFSNRGIDQSPLKGKKEQNVVKRGGEWCTRVRSPVRGGESPHKLPSPALREKGNGYSLIGEGTETELK